MQETKWKVKLMEFIY